MQPSDKRLQLDQNDSYLKWEWRIQRFGWGVGACILIAATMGFLGNGPLSSTEVSSANGGLKVTYDRYVHLNQVTMLDVRVNEQLRDDRKVRLHVSNAFLKSIELHRMQPEPTLSEIGADSTVFVFAQQQQSAEGRIIFHLEYEESGPITGEIQVAGGQKVQLQQFVYP